MTAVDGRTRQARTVILAALALGAGLFIAWMDTRPGWDDTGLTAGAVLLAAGLAGLAGVRPWLAALLVAGPMVVAEVTGNRGVLVAAVIAAVAAYAGAGLRRLRG